MAICNDGDLFAWGNHEAGLIGNGATANVLTPTRINGTEDHPLFGRKIEAISANEHHNLAICDQGDLWAWGNQHFGRLGDGVTGGANDFQPLPVQINLNIPGSSKARLTFKAISAGLEHSFAICEDNKLWGWGNSGGNRRLANDNGQAENRPIAITIGLTGEDRTVVSATASDTNSFAICDQGDLWAWGSRTNARLGDGQTGGGAQPVPLLIDTPNNRQIASVSIKASHTVALDAHGNIFGWGERTNGRLGLGSQTTGNQLEITRVRLTPPTNIDTNLDIEPTTIFNGRQTTTATGKITDITPSNFATWTFTYAIDETKPSNPASLSDSGLPLTIGHYTVTINYTDDEHFGTSQSNLQITPKPIIITPHLNQSKTVGTDDPINFSYSHTSLFDNTTINGSLSRIAGEEVGTYYFTLGTLNAGINYQLTLAQGIYFTIEEESSGFDPMILVYVGAPVALVGGGGVAFWMIRRKKDCLEAD
jgi:alpha-tubulin suppressor-like RCC1 family protein